MGIEPMYRALQARCPQGVMPAQRVRTESRNSGRGASEARVPSRLIVFKCAIPVHA